MENNETYIRLYRKLTQWEWYQNSHMVHLFIHLLISANRFPGRWHGIEVGTGQLITGRGSLKDDTGMSEQTIRTCLQRLKSTNEITIQSTNRYSIITLCNYHKYQILEIGNQPNNQQPNQQLTNNQPTVNQQLTTNNKGNKGKKGIKEEREETPSPRASIKILDDPITIAELKFKYPGVDVENELETMKDWLAAKGKVYKDYVAFARNWLKKPYAQSRYQSRKGNYGGVVTV